MAVRRTYKYILSPTRRQAQLLQHNLDLCRELYNAALQHRRDAYRMAGKSVSFAEQCASLVECKVVRPDLSDVYSQTLQDVLHRVDRAFKAFFLRVKRGEKAGKPGYPRYRAYERYNSITYPQLGWSLHNNRLTLSKLGTLKLKLHRPVQGKVKTVQLKREGLKWYVCFSVEVETTANKLPKSGKSGKTVGIDLGLTTFAVLSTGEKIENPRHLRKSLHKLATKQQALSRCKRGSHRRNKAKHDVARVHRRIRNQRNDFLHKQSCKLVRGHDTIVFEKLQPQNMVRNHNLALSISDASWGQFTQYVTYKAEWAGKCVLFVDPRYTSQQCSGCGAVKRKALSERWHSCDCGCSLSRDHNAAINILRAGSAQRDQLRLGA